MSFITSVSHLSELRVPVRFIARGESAGFSKQVAGQITVTTEVTVQARARAASDNELELRTVTCVDTTADTYAERSAACFCGDKTTNLPCRADLLPLPSDNLVGDYWSMARYDDISSQYTSRPSTAGTNVSTLVGSCIEKENKEPLQASQGRVTGCTDDLDELRLKWKSKGGMIVLVPARSRWHFGNWKKLICFG